MANTSIIAPVPKMHLDSALETQKSKGWFALGSDAWDILKDVEIGAHIWIYVSHDEAEPYVTYEACFNGLEGDVIQMMKIKKNGYRPKSAEHEKWGLYWKVSGLKPLAKAIPLKEIQLASGIYMTTYPRGPMHTKS